MGKPTYNRDIVTGCELTGSIEDGMEMLYTVALSAYGAQSGNVMIENRAGASTISHDGVTNLEALEVTAPVEDMTIQVVKQASRRTNLTAGDGTTLSTILAYHLYRWAVTAEEAGTPVADISREIEENSRRIVRAIDKRACRKVSDRQLRGVCEISAGDPELGHLIYDVVSSVGLYGGVNVIPTGSDVVSFEIIDGMYLDKGYSSAMLRNDTANNKSVLNDVPVVVLGTTVERRDQIVPILETLMTNNLKSALIIGDVVGDALAVLESTPKSYMDIMAVRPSTTNFAAILEDAALYTGARVFVGKPQDWNVEEHSGRVETATVTNRETTLVGGFGGDNLTTTIDVLTNRLASATPQERVSLEARIARLTAKVANIYVGGSTEVERNEKKLRVDDAVCAAKSALAGGIVAGGGVCLRDIAVELDLPYLVAPYSDLLVVSGIMEAFGDGAKLIEEARQQYDEYEAHDKARQIVWGARSEMVKHGSGYNLRTREKVGNMLRASIVDPAIVIKEAVKNSHSVVAKLITTTVALPFEDRKWDF